MILSDASATAAAGAALAPLLRPGDVVTLSGDLGAGKTTFARGVLAALGLAEEAPSPTFAIVQTYVRPEVRLPIAHVDLYRIRHPDEIEELGLDDMLDEGAVLIEWPERMGARLWPSALRLHLATDAGDVRRLTWHRPAAWEARWPPR
ncbi:MAG: hypothetical protein JWM75_1093 [Sphingomonas bacterium]|nr:hypothetical protein [Sphingomonas bacterium]